MTKEEALKLAQKAADNYSNSEDYPRHSWEEDWMSDWYDLHKTASLSFSVKLNHPKRYQQSVQDLADEIYLRSLPLYKVLDEN
jgi:hypothetical protein